MEAHTPTPMAVTTESGKLIEVVEGGMCGFATIVIRDRKFANFLKRAGIGRTRSYGGGYGIWVSRYGQSYERKVAYGEAVAAHLRNVGIDAWCESRLD